MEREEFNESADEQNYLYTADLLLVLFDTGTGKSQSLKNAGDRERVADDFVSILLPRSPRDRDIYPPTGPVRSLK